VRFERVFHLLGCACLLLAAALLLPLLLCLLQAPRDAELTRAFVLAAVTSACVGGALRLAFPWEAGELRLAEACAAMGGGWVAATALGALPFVLARPGLAPLDACFEVLSGLTTSGASVLDDPARLPPPLLLWRALTQWCGAVTFLALAIAVLPAPGAHGVARLRAGAPGTCGPPRPRFRPALVGVAALLAVLTLAQAAALWSTGLPPLEALCLALSTSTGGGFATRPDSLASLPPAAQWIALAGMLAAGLDVLLLAGLLRGRVRALLADVEVRVYVGALAAGALALLLLRPHAAGLADAARRALFTAGSALASSGLDVESPAAWGGPALVVLLALVGAGACRRSCASGLGLPRLLLLARGAARAVAGVCGLWLATLGAAALALLALGLPLQGACSTALCALANTGWGAQAPGAEAGWAELPPTARLVCMACMLAGRLEACAVLALLLRARRR